MSCLHSGNEAVVRRTIRRLHISFLHASAQKMAYLIRHAGAPSETLKLVQEIVDTCKVCRLWKNQVPNSITSTRLLTSFNDIVQCCMLIYKK